MVRSGWTVDGNCQRFMNELGFIKALGVHSQKLREEEVAHFNRRIYYYDGGRLSGTRIQKALKFLHAQ